MVLLSGLLCVEADRQPSAHLISESSSCCYLTFAISSLIQRLIDDINLKRGVLISPKSDWTKEQSSTISEWWQHRIENLYANNNNEGAEALFKEFHLDDEWD